MAVFALQVCDWEGGQLGRLHPSFLNKGRGRVETRQAQEWPDVRRGPRLASLHWLRITYMYVIH